MKFQYKINQIHFLIQLAIQFDNICIDSPTTSKFDKIAPDFVIVSHASNSFGLIAPVEKIFELAKLYDESYNTLYF